MFTNPYDTTPCQHFAFGKIKNSIEEAVANAAFRDLFKTVDFSELFEDGDEDDRLWSLRMVTPDIPISIIPLFSHPITIDDGWKENGKDVRTYNNMNSKWRYTVYIDVRNFTGLDINKKLKVNDYSEFGLTLLKGYLQLPWEGETDFTTLLSLGELPIKAYSRLITNRLSTQLNLDPAVKMRVSVIAAFFYICMFLKTTPGEEPSPLSNQEILEFSKMIGMGTGLPIEDVKSIISTLPIARDVGDFVDLLQKHTGSMRFDNFSIEVLYMLITSCWRGSNAKEVMAVALEHPPTWIALIYAGINERGFVKTYLGNMLKEMDHRDIFKQFKTRVENLNKGNY